MEKYSVLKTPAYAKVNAPLTRYSSKNYSETTGYSLTYYEPVYDLDLKIPGLGIAQVPFIPIQHTRKNRGKRTFVPRYLTEEDMKQINIKAEQKARDILKDFEPAQKASYESAYDFRTKKEIESKIEHIRDVCADVRDHVRRANKYDYSTQYFKNRATKLRFEEKDKKKDFVLDCYDDHLKELSTSLSKSRNHRRERVRYMSAGCERKEKKVEVEDKTEEPEDQPKEETKHVYTIPKNATELFESRFTDRLTKLRTDLSALKVESESFIENTRYKSLNIDELIDLVRS